MENPIKMDDLGVPLFSETPTYIPWRVQSFHAVHNYRLKSGQNLSDHIRKPAPTKATKNPAININQLNKLYGTSIVYIYSER